jgi:hypothetical protein
MPDVHSKWINGQLVFFDTYEYRFLHAVGPNVKRACFDFARLATDDTTGDPTGWTMTVVEAGAGGDSTAVVANGKLLITTDNAENDGVNLQAKGEAFKLLAARPLYFGCKLQINDADQTDIIIGLCITDTTLLGGMTYGIYFESVDGSAGISCVTEDNTAETQADSMGTLLDGADVTLEYYAPDATTVYFYIDGALVATHITNLPTTQTLTPSIHFLTGETTANTCAIDWLRAIQIQ